MKKLEISYFPEKKEINFRVLRNDREEEISSKSWMTHYMNENGGFVLQEQTLEFVENIAGDFYGLTGVDVVAKMPDGDFQYLRKLFEEYAKERPDTFHTPKQMTEFFMTEEFKNRLDKIIEILEKHLNKIDSFLNSTEQNVEVLAIQNQLRDFTNHFGEISKKETWSTSDHLRLEINGTLDSVRKNLVLLQSMIEEIALNVDLHEVENIFTQIHKEMLEHQKDIKVSIRRNIITLMNVKIKKPHRHVFKNPSSIQEFECYQQVDDIFQDALKKYHKSRNELLEEQSHSFIQKFEIQALKRVNFSIEDFLAELPELSIDIHDWMQQIYERHLYAEDKKLHKSHMADAVKNDANKQLALLSEKCQEDYQKSQELLFQKIWEIITFDERKVTLQKLVDAINETLEDCEKFKVI